MAAAMALAAAAAPGRATAEDGDIFLRVGGAAGDSFTAECELTSGTGQQVFTIEESLPFERRFPGRALRCRVTAETAFDVEVIKDGNRSRTRSSGGVVAVSIGS